MWTDGACRRNPGPAGGRRSSCRRTATRRSSSRRTRTTNNRMEFTAAIEGLRALPAGSRACIVTDSRLMLDSMTKWIAGWKRQGWKTAGGDPVKNQDLVRALEAEIARHAHVRWHWVAGTRPAPRTRTRRSTTAPTASRRRVARRGLTPGAGPPAAAAADPPLTRCGTATRDPPLARGRRQHAVERQRRLDDLLRQRAVPQQLRPLVEAPADGQQHRRLREPERAGGRERPPVPTCRSRCGHAQQHARRDHAAASTTAQRR